MPLLIPNSTPTQTCKINDLERLFNGSQFLISNADDNEFGVRKKMKLVEAAVQNAARLKKQDFIN